MRPLTPTNLWTPTTGCHPTRPWWRAGCELHDRSGWTRCDGWQATDNGYAYYSSAPISLDLDIDTETPEGTSYDEVLAAVDAAYPLPPVILRAGQVWLLEARQAVVTALLNTTMHKFLRTSNVDAKMGTGAQGIFPHDTMYGVEAFEGSAARHRAWMEEQRHATMGFNPYDNGGFLLGDQFLLPDAAARLLLGNDPIIKAYLIADPADPNFTPWTGAREGKW